MVYVFGINLPIAEMMFVAILFFLVGLGFMIWQMIQVNKHMQVLERTTFEIKQYEEQEQHEVERLETDVKSFETDEAELFVARVVPTVAKLENFVMAQIFHGKKPEVIVDMLVAKKIDKTLATRVVNQVGFYLNFYHKLPKKHEDTHHGTVEKLQMPQAKGKPQMPDISVQNGGAPAKTAAKKAAKTAKK